MFHLDRAAALIGSDIRRLIDDGVAESEILDFKTDMPSKAGAAWSPAQEFAKDVAAFANNRGGQVVLGVRDREKIACSIRPLTDSFEHIERKLRKWLRDHLSPAVSVEIDEVPVDGGIVVVVTVPQSTDQPHAVTSPGNDRRPLVYPCRDGADTRYMAEHELADRHVERQRGRRERTEEFDSMVEDCFDRLRRGPGLWLWVGAQPDAPARGRLDARRVREITRWWLNERWVGPIASGVLADLPIPAPGRATFTERPYTESDDDGDPRSSYVELFVNGSAFVGMDMTRLTSWEPVAGEIGEYTLADALIPVIGVVSAWSHEAVGSSGIANIAFGLIDTGPEPAEATLVTERFGKLKRIRSTRALEPSDGGLIFWDRTAADIGVLGSWPGRLSLAHAALSLFVQRFGLAEATQMTADGKLVLKAWSEQHVQEVRRWADERNVEVI